MRPLSAKKSESVTVKKAVETASAARQSVSTGLKAGVNEKARVH